MSPRPVDLSRVTQGLARLDALREAYPELREPETQARLAVWLAQEQRMAQQRRTKKHGDVKTRARVQRLRERRKQAGWQPYELWLDPDTAALLVQLKQSKESLYDVIRRALLALHAQEGQESARGKAH